MKKCLSITLVIIAIISTIMLVNYSRDKKSIEIPNPIETIDQSISDIVDDTIIDESEIESVMIPEYMELYETNPDFTGWITIEDTNIDYPIMCSIDDYDYYLSHDFYKDKNSHGSIFIGKDTMIDSTAVIIYGHNMKDGSMLHDLEKFLNEDFFNSHSTVRINTLYDKKEYEVISVFRDKVHTVDDTSFKFYNYYGEPEEDEFNDYVNFLSKNSIYSRDIDSLTIDTKIIQLVTCAYHTENGRLVVVLKEV